MFTVGDFIKASQAEKEAYMAQFELEGKQIVLSNLRQAKADIREIKLQSLHEVDRIIALYEIFNRSLL